MIRNADSSDLSLIALVNNKTALKYEWKKVYNKKRIYRERLSISNEYCNIYLSMDENINRKY